MIEKYTECEVHPNCTFVATAICTACHRPFCENHASDLDKSLCFNCLSISNTVIQSKPLIDSEGVTHKGVHHIVSGEAFLRNVETISKLSDQELDAKLTAIDKVVSEIEHYLVQARVHRSMVYNEKDKRLSRRYSRIRLIAEADAAHKRLHPINGESKTVPTKKPTTKTPENPFDLFVASLKKLGMNQTQIAQAISQLMKEKK